MAEKNIDLSIIVTAHNEGILAHKTILSLFRAAKKLEERNIVYEVIVHIDNGNAETKEYFSRYAHDSKVRILENHFGDPSLSRNYAISEAYGSYIASIDGDDLCSENWLIDSYSAVYESVNKIARVNYVVTFGGKEVVLTENKNMSKEDAIIHLIDSNAYAAPFVCSKEVYQSIKQRKNSPPYAYEDWQFSVDALGQGVDQIVVPETVLFYRRSVDVKPSVLSMHDSARSVLSPTKLFSFDSIRSLSVDKYKEKHVKNKLLSRIDRRLKRELRLKSYHTIKYLKSFKTLAKIKEAVKPSRQHVQIPDWLVSEWKQINKIEKNTFPSKGVLARVISWYPNRDAGIGYVQITKELTKKPDTLFFVPWLIRGGADKVFINTANEIAKAHPDWSLAMMQTLRHPSVWQDKLDKTVDFVDMAAILSGLSYEHQIRLMAQFIVQNNIKRVLIGNSKFAYDLVLRYKKLIQALDITVYAFAFTEIIDPDGRICDYIHEDLPYVNDVVYRIVTDNTSIVDQLYTEHAISREKIFVHHQFLNNAFREPQDTSNVPLKVMWASRISRQKVPEVLLEIGRRLPENFTIDVYGEIEVHYSKKMFDGSGINYIRRFNGVDDLPVQDYDVFLYTSSADGMPNILLEMGSKGLPIIAPNVGGVQDFIRHEETGLLIDNYRDVEGYIAALNQLKDTNLRIKLSTNAQVLLKKEFTESKWKKAVKTIFDR